MQQNYPYPGPQYGMPPGPPFGADPGKARSVVQGPAIGLIVIGILGVVGQLGSIAMNLFGAGMGAVGAAGSGDEAIFQLFSGVVGLVLGGLWLVLYGVVIFGGVKMKSLENYPLAMTSSILALLPCSFCCVLTMPIGIWSLVILLNQDVKAAFR